jgi:hypothetical protein
MVRSLIVVLLADSEGVERFCDTLPRVILQCRVDGWNTFRVPMDRLSVARELRRRARAAGLEFEWAGETDWSAEDSGRGRLCLLLPPVGPRLDERSFVTRQRCPRCGGFRYFLAAEPSIDLHLGRHSPPPVFASESGLTTIMSVAAESELRTIGLMRGAATLPVTVNGSPTAEFRALTSTTPLGDVADVQYTRRCSECNRPIEGGGFFPMYPHPPESGDLFFSDRLGPTNPFVSEPFARAVGRIVGNPPDAPLAFVGWWPDDQEEARMPDLDSDDINGLPRRDS